MSNKQKIRSKHNYRKSFRKRLRQMDIDDTSIKTFSTNALRRLQSKRTLK